MNKEPTKEQIEANVIHSTENAQKALEHLERSLINGRFKEGITSYKKLTETLIGQRIWTSDKTSSKLNENFNKIAETSTHIVEILEPYVDNFRKLSLMKGERFNEENGSEESLENQLSVDQQKLLDLINSTPKRSISFSKLRAEMGIPSRELERLIGEIGKNGYSIKVDQNGSRKVVVLDI